MHASHVDLRGRVSPAHGFSERGVACGKCIPSRHHPRHPSSFIKSPFFCFT
jgi:hypothetical protein